MTVTLRGVSNKHCYLISIAYCLFFHCIQSVYRNDPKFSDTQALANSADPDQTAPRGTV